MMNENEFTELAAGHALHALSASDAAAFAAERRSHPEWEPIVTDAEAAASGIADTVAEVHPPARIKTALFDLLDSTPQHPATPEAAPAAEAVATPAAEPATPSEPPVAASAPTAQPAEARDEKAGRQRLFRGWFALAASLVLLVGGITVGVALSQNQTPAAQVAMQEIEGAADAQVASVDLGGGSTASIHWSESVGRAVLESEGLPEIDDQSAYELWIIRDGAPVSAGTFDDSGSSITELDGALQDGDTVAVTIEQKGGSETGQPTTTPILAIET